MEHGAMLYRPDEHEALIACYRDGLLNNVLPFWMRHAIDREHGGFLHALDRDGSLLDDDKSMWIQCRFTWLLATLYNTVEPRREWLDLATHGIRFIRAHGIDADGRVFFQVARDGRPLRKRRYVFAECFAAMALAAYARATGDKRAAAEARALYRTFLRHVTTPGLLEPKLAPGTRAMQTLGVPMMAIVTAQTLRENLVDQSFDREIDRWIQRIADHFVKHDRRAVMENVGPAGEIVDHFDGRILNPGHAIETAWFILNEARHRGNDGELVALGAAMIDYMWERGWDREHGGILYFRDIDDKPVQEYWHDMKFWWPQTDTIASLLTAYLITGDAKYRRWHREAHDWAHRFFPDPEFGEWFGYLHRDGRVSVPLKGNMWKGPFHLPRMQLHCWQMLQQYHPQPAATR